MRSGSTTRAPGRARRRAAVGAAPLLLLLFAAPAAAQVPPPPDAVQDVVDTVDEVTSSDDPVSEVVDAVDEAAGDVTGTEDPVESAVDDVVDKVDDAEQAVDDTVADVRDKAGNKAQEVVDRVDEASGGTVGEVVGGTGSGGEGPGGGGTPGGGGEGLAGRSLSPDGLVSSVRGRAVADIPARTGPGDADTAAASARESDSHTDVANSTPSGAEPGLGERLRRAAIDASKKLALPLSLTLVVLAYLVAQYWADRKDPKFVLAPVDADHDLLSFQ